MSEIDLVKQRKMLVWSICFLSAAWGIHSALNPQPLPIDSLLLSIIAIIVTSFCLVESQILRKPIPVLAGWQILIAWPLAVPLCLFWIYMVEGNACGL